MAAVGRRLAAGIGRAPAGSLAARAEAGAALLNSLGGAAQVEARDGSLVIRGCGGCPLSVAAAHRAAAGQAVQVLLSEYVGAPVAECCERGERPRCSFAVSPAA